MANLKLIPNKTEYIAEHLPPISGSINAENARCCNVAEHSPMRYREAKANTLIA